MKFDRLEHVDSLLNEATAIRWIPLSALKTGVHLSCIDGRHSECVVATPGGDTGLFIALMTAIENQHGPLDRDYVDRALEVIMEWHSRFYMHTDTAAIGRLERHVLQTVGVKLSPGQLFETYLRQPPQGHRATVQRALIDPTHVGCGFLQQMLQDPAGYAVRKQVVQWTILKFFNHLWSGSSAPRFEVLPGEHDERAVLLIETDMETQTNAFLPALRGEQEGPSRLFLHHRLARQFLARENLRLLVNAAHLPDINLKQALAFVDKLCDAQLTRVSNALASHLPTFMVTFDRSGENPEVKKL